VDAAYQAKYLSMARLLWQASEGNPCRIPSDYAEYLNHTYADGSISLVSLLPKFDYSEELEPEEIEEAIEILGKVNPGDWPDIEDILEVSLDEILACYEEDASYDFVEDNISVGYQVEKSLEQAISSVFGGKVSKIRNQKGHEPNVVNNFLQQEDGTFMGTFEYESNQFLFELYPDEQGWVLTYRMSPKSLDSLPPLHEESTGSKGRHIRHRGWK